MHQEDVALAMEQKLLHHYLVSHPDPRVVNESFTAGQATKDKCYAYAVYMAFRYEGESSPSTMCQYSEPGPSHTSPSPTNSPLPTRRSSSVQQRKEGKKGKSSVSQTQPTLLTQYAISSTAAPATSNLEEEELVFSKHHKCQVFLLVQTFHKPWSKKHATRRITTEYSFIKKTSSSLVTWFCI